ncbi:sugar phosphate isomerase/epimerase family protein [Anaerocolumna xylanovorans]|uniref:Sugar phosphate isomerase/epimerase n=1 Tax=Anaerocolumna xylanovorans DSM 12503 TaxID=1121345 RepID=A0A1M7YFU5_9FIRM|nr:sugar phosphate isomerase/epimerase family protein [Anaerocolumna xylanovorans]SHO51514.1 Sugar phosphate isomerase/epimerase [Anaerocolumna xylanovorans DSM 12503]
MLKLSKITGFADEISEELKIQIRLLKELGMEYLEFRSAGGRSVADFAAGEVKEIRAYLDSEGIKVSAIGSPVGKISINDSFKEHFDSFKRVAETAHILNTPNIRIFSFYIPETEEAGKYKNEVIERLGRLKDYGKSNGVILLHENEKGIYGDSALRCKDIMEALFGDSFKAVFDFANFVQCKEDTVKAYELLKPYISYVHIKDALKETGEVRVAGEGDGRVKEILKELDKEGYRGFLSLEPHLADFAGFRQLERDGMNFSLSDSERAFTMAYEALRNILNQ